MKYKGYCNENLLPANHQCHEEPHGSSNTFVISMQTCSTYWRSNFQMPPDQETYLSKTQVWESKGKNKANIQYIMRGPTRKYISKRKNMQKKIYKQFTKRREPGTSVLGVYKTRNVRITQHAARSLNPCCGAKARSITYSECASAALII
jgi:hypothetical protein